jgi:hypothetical protein
VTDTPTDDIQKWFDGIRRQERDRRREERQQRRTTTTADDAARQERHSAGHSDCVSAQDWESWLAARLEQEREFLLDCVGDSLGEFVGEQLKFARLELRSEIREMQVELAKTQTEIANLRAVLAANGKGELLSHVDGDFKFARERTGESSEAGDLPNPLTVRRDLN